MDHTPGFWCLCTGGLGLPSGSHLSIPCISPEPLPTHGYFQKPGQPGLIIQRQGRREEEEEETAAKKSWRQSGGAGGREGTRQMEGSGERERMCGGLDEGWGKVRDSTRGQADQTEAGQMDGKERYGNLQARPASSKAWRLELACHVMCLRQRGSLTVSERETKLGSPCLLLCLFCWNKIKSRTSLVV